MKNKLLFLLSITLFSVSLTLGNNSDPSAISYNFKKLEDDLVTIEMLLDDRPIGAAIYELIPKKHTLNLIALAICEKNRRKGYGQKLFQFIITIAKKYNYQRVEWVIQSNSAQDLIKFYNKCGGKIKSIITETDINMEYIITKN